MNLPTTSTASDRLVWFYGLYYISRLIADPVTAFLAAIIQLVQDGLAKAADATRKARAVKVVKQAIRDHSDLVLDEAVGAFELFLLGLVSRNRDAALYRLYFPNGLQSVTRAPLGSEVISVEVIESHLETAAPELKAYGPKIRTAREALQKAIAELTQASRDVRLAVSNEMAARDAWVQACRKTHGSLITLFPDKPAKAEDYFRPRDIAEEPEVEASTPSTSSEPPSVK